MKIVMTILARNSIRLVLAFAAVAGVTWLLAWHAQSEGGMEVDCARIDADGNWQFPYPCFKE